MLNIAICDDAQVDRQILLSIINQLEESYQIKFIVTLFDCGEKLIAFLESSTIQIDLIFLDIYMNGLNGMETAIRIREKDKEVNIVFATASAGYAIEGYKVGAKGYILKPYNRTDIWKILGEIICQKRKQRMHKEKPFLLEWNSRVYSLHKEDIRYIESKGKEVWFYTNCHGKIVIKNTLNNIQENIKDDIFLRCHRSFIVNLDYVKSIQKYEFTLYSGENVDIKKREFTHFKIAYYHYIENKYKNRF